MRRKYCCVTKWRYTIYGARSKYEIQTLVICRIFVRDVISVTVPINTGVCIPKTKNYITADRFQFLHFDLKYNREIMSVSKTRMLWMSNQDLSIEGYLTTDLFKPFLPWAFRIHRNWHYTWILQSNLLYEGPRRRIVICNEVEALKKRELDASQDPLLSHLGTIPDDQLLETYKGQRDVNNDYLIAWQVIKSWEILTHIWDFVWNQNHRQLFQRFHCQLRLKNGSLQIPLAKSFP